MTSRQSEIPALESSLSEGLLGAMSLPIGFTRHALGYDDAFDAPMGSPPSDMNVNTLWRNPLIPQRKFKRLSEVEALESVETPTVGGAAAARKPPIPVVKTKASCLMSSLMTKQTQEVIQGFEQQAGLTDTSYTPHKGLTAEEARYHRMAEALHKLKVPSGDPKEDKQTSAQSTPSVTPSITPNVTPHSTPRQNRRSFFGQSSVAFLSGSESSTSNTSVDMGGNEGGGGGGGVERWSLFGTRSIIQKSSSASGTDSKLAEGFSLQSCMGAQKSTSMETMKVPVAPTAEDPTNFKTPKLEIPDLEGKKQMPRPHKLKPRDMNILTPSGF